MSTTELAPLATPLDGHPGVTKDFGHWVTGGPAQQTAVEDNILTRVLNVSAL